MRYLLPAALILSAAACAPTAPNDAAPSKGAGFGSYTDYLKQHEGQSGATTPVAPASGAAASAGASAGAPLVGTSALADSSDPTAGLAGDRPRGGAPSTIKADTGEMAAVNDPKISDEQSFAAVSARETIASDKERLAQQRAQYKVIPPTAVPSRPVEIPPNVVEYAVQSTNPIGKQIYHRGNPFRNAISRRSCAKFPSADKAQEMFLANGGPQRDPKSLDPDGDGYACGWDPAPFRAAMAK